MNAEEVITRLEALRDHLLWMAQETRAEKLELAAVDLERDAEAVQLAVDSVRGFKEEDA